MVQSNSNCSVGSYARDSPRRNNGPAQQDRPPASAADEGAPAVRSGRPELVNDSSGLPHPIGMAEHSAGDANSIATSSIIEKVRRFEKRRRRQLEALHGPNAADVDDLTDLYLAAPEVIDDDSEPMPVPTAAIHEDKGDVMTSKKRLDVIEDDEDAPNHIGLLNDEVMESIEKHPPASSAGQVAQSQGPSQQSQTFLTSPPNQVLENNQNSSTNSDGHAQNQAPALLVRPTPQSMLPRPSSANDTTAPPIFHEVPEARVVQDDPTAPVYPATIVTDADAPWWKRHQKYTIFGIVFISGVAMAIMGTLLATQGNSDGSGAAASQDVNEVLLRDGDKPTRSPTFLLISNIPSEEHPKNSTILLGSNSTIGGLFGLPISDNLTNPLKPNSTSDELVDSTIDDFPTNRLSKSPSFRPSERPSEPPSMKPTHAPTFKPTLRPSTNPTKIPTAKPALTNAPTARPTTLLPSKPPSAKPTPNTPEPTKSPSAKPSVKPSDINLVSQIKLLPSDDQAGGRFGTSVSVSGDKLVIGAPGDDGGGNDSGSAYVFIRHEDSWKEQAKLLPIDLQTGDSFGRSVSMSGDTVVIGAHMSDDNGISSGCAYVFTRTGDTWIQQAKLLPHDGQVGDKFGFSVSVSGDVIVVGAHSDDENGVHSGSAYVFFRDRGSWKQQAKLLPNDGHQIDWFGFSVSASGDTVAIGSRYHGDNGFNSGSAYVFIREGDKWRQQAKLLANNGNAHDNFGISVSVSGDAVVVGAYKDDDNGSNSGSAYVFIREEDSWKQQAHLMPNDGQVDENFGFVVSLSGGTIVIGNDSGPWNDGFVYVFVRDGEKWNQKAKLSSDWQASNTFGSAVSVDGDTIVVGAHEDDDNGVEGGSVYVFG